MFFNEFEWPFNGFPLLFTAFQLDLDLARRPPSVRASKAAPFAAFYSLSAGPTRRIRFKSPGEPCALVKLVFKPSMPKRGVETVIVLFYRCLKDVEELHVSYIVYLYCIYILVAYMYTQDTSIYMFSLLFHWLLSISSAI